jgi:uncharacterized membrane protein
VTATLQKRTPLETSPWWRWVWRLLNVLALALSGYLSWHYVLGESVLGCGGGSSCDQVLNSRWSSIGGLVPVSGLAAGAYLAMLVASFFVGAGTEAPIRRLAWSVILMLAGSAAGSALWFIAIQKWSLGAFCPYCLATHVIGVAIAALLVWQAPRQSRALASAAGSEAKPDLSRSGAIGYLAAGLAMAGLLALAQVVFAPPSVYRSGEAQAKLPAIDPRTSPLIGSPDARYIVSLLYDYKCPHCQELHFMLGDVVRRYHGQLAFQLCPTPLSLECNPYVPIEVDEFKGSCALAKTALAVFKARPEAFAEFDLWLYSHETGDAWKPRSLEAAKAKAIELVGQTQFEAAQASPWIGQYLEASIQIYGTTVQGGNNAVPKLVFGSRWVIPQPNNTADLLAILHASLGIPSP